MQIIKVKAFQFKKEFQTEHSVKQSFMKFLNRSIKNSIIFSLSVFGKTRLIVGLKYTLGFNKILFQFLE